MREIPESVQVISPGLVRTQLRVNRFLSVEQHLVAHAKRVCTGGYNVSNAIIYQKINSRKEFGRSLQAIRSFLPVNPYLSEAFGWKRKEWKLFRNVVQHLVAHAKRIRAGGYNVSNAIIYRTG
jgi:hypothetical protein